MTDPVARLAQAEVAAAAARARLNASLAILQQRLEPKRLVRDARRELVEARGVATRRTVAAVRANPTTLAGAVAVAGLFVARHRIVALFRRS